MKTKLLIAFFTISFISNAQYTKLLDFDGQNGNQPFGDLISDGTFLYGMAYKGGGYDLGLVFRIKHDGTGDTTLYSFAGGADGSGPFGALISDGTFLYGMTAYGGTYSAGTIFKIKPDGTGYSVLHEFTNIPDGMNPGGSLIYDGTFLYGTAHYGGLQGGGMIFKIKPDGTAYTVIYDFMPGNGIGPDGDLLLIDSSLYGLAQQGGLGAGTIFRIDTNGTNYADIFYFNGTNGNGPVGSLIYDGTYFYGTTFYGGIFTNCANGCGIIFKVKPDGTGDTTLHDFSGYPDGQYPTGSLVSDGSYLFGTTLFGGGNANSFGTLFKIKPDGTSYTKLMDFTGITDGKYPYCTPYFDGSCLYGMTSEGGINNMGTIFKYCLTLGIDENNSEINFTIYPNPTSGVFTIESKENFSTIEITNVLGEKVYLTQSTQLTINLSDQPNGIYFLQLKTEVGIASKKLIIQK